MIELFANSGDPDQIPVSDLGLHCLPATLLGVSRLQWVNSLPYLFHNLSKSILTCQKNPKKTMLTMLTEWQIVSTLIRCQKKFRFSLTSFDGNFELNNVVVLLTDICARHL